MPAVLGCLLVVGGVHCPVQSAADMLYRVAGSQDERQVVSCCCMDTGRYALVASHSSVAGTCNVWVAACVPAVHAGVSLHTLGNRP
jgi:hypothetical protein